MFEHPHAVERLFGAAPIRLGIPPRAPRLAQPSHKRNIHDGNGKYLADVGVLRDVAHAARRRLWRLPQNSYLAPLRFQDSQNQFDERCFASAIWTDDSDEFPLLNCQVHIFQYDLSVVGEPKIFNRYHFILPTVLMIERWNP